MAETRATGELGKLTKAQLGVLVHVQDCGDWAPIRDLDVGEISGLVRKRLLRLVSADGGLPKFLNITDAGRQSLKEQTA